MAFSDWTLYDINDITITPNTTNQLEGFQSLDIEKTSGVTVFNAGAVKVSDVAEAGGMTRGITAGRMRTQMQRLSGGVNPGLAGIYCMLTSTTDPTLSSVDAYTLNVEEDGSMSIRKVSNGLPDNTPVILATGANEISDVTSPFTIELMWFYDIPEFNGIRLIAKKGLMSDYSDLAPISSFDVIDASTPLSSSLGEGLFYATNNAAEAKWIFDRTELYSVAFV